MDANDLITLSRNRKHEPLFENIYIYTKVRNENKLDIKSNSQRRLKLLDLVIAKADKGETLVILNRLDYVNQIHQFLEQSGATPMRYKFTERNEAIRSILANKNSLLFGNEGEKLTQMCVATPRLYGQMKLHKTGNPIRPVISSYTDPS